MNKAIKVRTVESKLSQKGNMYYPITLEDGSKASAFDKDFVENVLTKAMNEGILIEVDLETNEQGYTNIRPKKAKNGDGGTMYSQAKPTIKASSGFNQTAMYVSYAKDIFVAGMGIGGQEKCTFTMKECIDLVKQAKEGLQ